jgi:hypothetical protein
MIAIAVNVTFRLFLIARELRMSTSDAPREGLGVFKPIASTAS